MKYTSTKSAVSCIVCIVLVVAFALSLTGREKNIPTEEPPAPANTTKSQLPVGETVTHDYILKSYEGKLAVYLTTSNSPEMVLNVYIHLLPEYDRVRLQTGIPVKDYATLVMLLEDYTS